MNLLKSKVETRCHEEGIGMKERRKWIRDAGILTIVLIAIIGIAAAEQDRDNITTESETIERIREERNLFGQGSPFQKQLKKMCCMLQ